MSKAKLTEQDRDQLEVFLIQMSTKKLKLLKKFLESNKDDLDYLRIQVSTHIDIR